ncbi:hypothetical protein GGTG_02433 [Gaeumannomyces tritici R3-111a-1]|uniref:Zn(2)-C6 fungal-type domain-containing protein n=1 Tax=Gaeumannomyces tritici (strain R3-111a-1) TaxID=644352 RepID=J3NMC9_GAET3|nr:hypothetical protein GGTG_02433 [Gaeumannomyces tritici R3-111a-1]EJT82460.1 hypothetical protein GGTG_02433 [Gaeumannomyces tritici R3-111a-1]
MDKAAPKRHCWECLRLNLVCDATKPECSRCVLAATSCPGYGDTKPTRLRWLAPGRVKSRRTKTITTGHDDNKSLAATAPSQPPPLHDEEASASASLVPMAIDENPELTDTALLLFQAMEYYNSCIYMDMWPIHQLGQHPNLYPVSVAHVRQGLERPAYLQFGMMCMALVHRINRLGGPACPQSKALARQFYQFRGIAIHGLSQGIGTDSSLADNCLIAGILTVLLNDCNFGTGLHASWRYHLQGLYRLITLRGGFVALAESPGMAPLLTSFWSVAVYGNTTCPADDLVGTSTCLDCVEFILKRCAENTTPFLLCPPGLFVEIIKINHLRWRAATATQERRAEHKPSGAIMNVHDHGLTGEAMEIMVRVAAFSPDLWADHKRHQSSRSSWALAGRLYQAVVTIYCISSLRSASVLPHHSHVLDACQAACLRLAHAVLSAEQGGLLASPSTRRFMLWPLVVMGVEAAAARDDERDGEDGSGSYGATLRVFVSEQLVKLSADLSTNVPLTAKGVLDVFWAKLPPSLSPEYGRARWDDCFDRPYALTTQIAVDTDRLGG